MTFPKGILTRDKGRIEAESLSYRDQVILDGNGFVAQWRESNIAPGESRYLSFVGPANRNLWLDFRKIQTDKDSIRYFGYPANAYTAGPVIADNANDYVKVSNCREAVDYFYHGFNRVDMTTPPAVIPAADAFTVNVDIFGATGVGGTSSGNLESNSAFALFNPGTEFLVEIRNNGSNNANVVIDYVYALLPLDRVPPFDTGEQ